MKLTTLLLSFFLSENVLSAQVTGLPKGISNLVESAIQDYFKVSGRKLERIEIEGYSHYNSSVLDYLVEAGVIAQSANSDRIINYRCGVFLKKVSSKWMTQYTQCEPLDTISP